MTAARVISCQHCSKKSYIKLSREISWTNCPRCGQLTPTTADQVEQRTRRLVEDPGLHFNSRE